MLRIAKPGAPVIVEHVSLPLCDSEFDFGGVPMTFWNTTASWTSRIKLGSVVIKPDKLATDRYHVFLRKKKEQQTGILT